MKTVFFGSSSLVLPVVQTLKDKFGLSLILTTETESYEPVLSYARKNGIQSISISKLSEQTINKIKQEKADVGIVADFGIIIPKNVMEIFPHGILNIHPSLLPKYRGSTPIPSAILNGETKTGVSLIKIDEKVDHGPILMQKETPISEKDNSLDLLERLFAEGASLIEESLEDFVKDVLKPHPQDDSRATFTKTLSRNDGYVDFLNSPSKEKLNQMIRAYYPWPSTWTKFKLNDKELIIKLLPNEEIQVEGKKPMSYKDFKNGYEKGEEFLKKLSLG